MKHINLFSSVIFFCIFLYDITQTTSNFTWGWFLLGLLNLTMWVQYTVVTELKEYIDKKFNELK